MVLVSQIPGKKGMSLPPWLECGPCEAHGLQTAYVPSLALVQELSGLGTGLGQKGSPREGWAGEVVACWGRRHTTLILRSGFRTPGLLSWLFRRLSLVFTMRRLDL